MPRTWRRATVPGLKPPRCDLRGGASLWYWFGYIHAYRVTGETHQMSIAPQEGYGSSPRYEAEGFRGLCEDRSLSARSPRWRRLPSGLLSFGAHAVGAVYTTSGSKWFEGLRGAAVPLLTVGKASAISVGRLRNLLQSAQWRTECYPAPQPCTSHLSKHCSLFPRTRRNAQSRTPHDIKWNLLRHRH